MIERIELRDFKAHAHTVIDLERLTVLVGPNSSGKTSVLEALNLSAAMMQQTATPLRFPRVMEFIRKSAGSAHLNLDVDGKQVRAVIEQNPADKHPAHYHAKQLDQRPSFVRAGGPEIATPGRAVLTSLDVSAMRVASELSAGDEPQHLTSSGANLGAQLAFLKLSDEGAFERLVEDLRAIVPSVEGVHAIPSRRGPSTSFSLSIDFRGAPKVSSSMTSEGTLIALALLTYLHEPNPPTLMLVDDIDRGLHPGAQIGLIAILRRLLDHRPELQIVVTTHSPYIVEAVGASAVRVCALRDDGTVALAPLTAHPHAAKALRLLNAAEFWDAEGESWVTEVGSL